MSKVRLSPPWITFVNEIKQLFAEDMDVKVKYDDENYTVSLYVDNTDKANALAKLLPQKKEFGNVTLTIEVIPANKEDLTDEQLFQEAFSGNPAMQLCISYDTPFGKITYVVFQKKVVQFFNDQLDDINGNKSMLFQDIARDVFGENSKVFYCTDASGNLAKPLGEWP